MMIAIIVAVSHASADVISPGLVVLRGAISERDQVYLAQSTHKLGARKINGFHDASGNLNAAMGRGRIYDRSDKLPSRFTQLARSAVRDARRSDEAMPDCTPSHCLINYYSSACEGFKWHRDIYENDGDGDHPVINICVGSTCTFGVRIDGRTVELQLRSGDALLFGGPCRFVEHAVLNVDHDDRPSWMAKGDLDGRLSFTFREASSVLGREDFFRNFDVGAGWFEKTQSVWRLGDPLVAAPSGVENAG